MIKRVTVAAAGVGNNISALVQGIALHRVTGSLTGIHRPVLEGLSVGDIDFVAGFATSPEKIGRDLAEAIFLPPNNRTPGVNSPAVPRGPFDALPVVPLVREFPVMPRPADQKARAATPATACRVPCMLPAGAKPDKIPVKTCRSHTR